MKKLLVLISLILCFSMLFVACGKENNNGEENIQPEDNIEANIAKLVSELNKGDSFADLFDSAKTTVDYKELVAELKKVSAQGAVDLTATTDGEEEGSLTASFAIKDNVLHAEANNGDETVGIDGSISDAYKLVFATWGFDEGEELDVYEAMAFDIASIMDEVMAMAEESMGEEMPIDLSELKLPEFKAEHITYKDGQYILDKNFLYDSIIATAESFIDAAKDEGLIDEEMGIDEQFEEIKEQAKAVVDAVEFKLYYLIKCEVIEGMGVSVNLKAADIAEALELDADEIGGFDYIKADLEATLKGTTVAVEYKETEDSHVNKVSYDVQFIFDGEAICGVDAKYNMDVKSTSKSQYQSDDDYGYWSKYESTDVIKMDMSIKLDLSKFDDANSTVLDAKVSYENKYDSVDESGSNYSETEKSENHGEDKAEITMTVKTTEANKADVVMNGNIVDKYTYTSTSEHREDESKDEEYTIGLTGTIEFTTKDVTVPAPDAAVKDAMDNAEVVTSVMGHAEEAPTPDYGYGEDYPSDDYYAEENW